MGAAALPGIWHYPNKRLEIQVKPKTASRKVLACPKTFAAFFTCFFLSYGIVFERFLPPDRPPP